jgi:hypothetical protein
MLFKVLKAFPYAHDHHTVKMLAVDSIVEIADGVVEGLLDEKFIIEATDEEIEATQTGAVLVRAPVEIPDDWATLGAFKMTALAKQLTGGKVKTKAAAVAVIEAELAARAQG